MITLKGRFALGFDEHFDPVSFTHLWRQDVLDMTLKTMGNEVFLPPIASDPLPTVSYVNLWSNNYFHFVTELMASIIKISKEAYEQILVQDKVPGYILGGLGLLGLRNKASHWDGRPKDFPELLASPRARYDGYSNSEDLALLNDMLGVEGSAHSSELIYVSREDAVSRRVANENVIPSKYNKVVLTGVSFERQVQLFRNAKVIIGPHGAGMTNMIWAQPGCRIIEFFGRYHNDCFQKLAATLGHEYIGIVCEPANRSDMKVPGGIL